MARWWDKSIECAGVVLFRGTLPPRAEDMPDFGKLGFTAAKADAKPNMHWRLKLDSPALGRAEVFAARQPPVPTAEQLKWVTDLTPNEREQARLGESSVVVMFKGKRDHLLRDRKTLLKLLGAIGGGDALVAFDVTAGRFWSPGSLADELAHDADVDVSALYNIHAVTGEGENAPLIWGHTHGLADIGLFDFDLIHPHRDYFTLQTDVVRAVALRIAEGKLKLNGDPEEIAGPGVFIRALDAADFDRRAAPRDRDARDSLREEHTKNRAVICEPAVTGLSRFWKKDVAPSRFFQTEPDPRKPVFYSAESNGLAAERAHGSYPLFRALMAELPSLLPLEGMVKIAYPVDGRPDDREHMWFTVHEAGDDFVDATLAVRPFNISGMKQGDRGRHSIGWMTDWIIPTPLGNITSRSTTPARILREHAPQLRAAMAQRENEPD